MPPNPGVGRPALQVVVPSRVQDAVREAAIEVVMMRERRFLKDQPEGYRAMMWWGEGIALLVPAVAQFGWRHLKDRNYHRIESADGAARIVLASGYSNTGDDVGIELSQCESGARQEDIERNARMFPRALPLPFMDEWLRTRAPDHVATVFAVLADSAATGVRCVLVLPRQVDTQGAILDVADKLVLLDLDAAGRDGLLASRGGSSLAPGDRGAARRDGEGAALPPPVHQRPTIPDADVDLETDVSGE